MSPVTPASRRKDDREEITAAFLEFADAVDDATREIVHAVLDRGVRLKRVVRAQCTRLLEVLVSEGDHAA